MQLPQKDSCKKKKLKNSYNRAEYSWVLFPTKKKKNSSYRNFSINKIFQLAFLHKEKLE